MTATLRRRTAQLLTWWAKVPDLPVEYLEVPAGGDAELGLGATGATALAALADAADALAEPTIVVFVYGGHLRLTVIGATGPEPDASMVNVTVAISGGPAHAAVLNAQNGRNGQTLDVASLRAAELAVAAGGTG